MIPRTLAVMLTNKCNFFCDHCSVCAGPDVNDVLSDELIQKAIDQAYFIPSIKIVAFTGGEVTLYPEKLKRAIAYAHSRGFITRIVTNAWWASTKEKANAYCQELADCGLDEINISYDDFHAEYLERFGGEQNVIYAIQASQKAKLSLLIGIVLSPQNNINGNYIQRHIEQKIEYFEGKVAPFGRAREKLPEEYFSTDDKVEDCDEAGASLVILPTGEVAFCCGHSLFSKAKKLFVMGNLYTNITLLYLFDIMQRNVLIWFIYLNGPTKLLKEIGGNETVRSNCEACFYLGVKYKNKLLELSKNKKEIFLELKKQYEKEQDVYLKEAIK